MNGSDPEGGKPTTSVPPRPQVLLQRLLAWYDQHRRALPWRSPPGVPPDPYHVLLSEVMLQQTTVATASARFAAFLQRFPSVHALAATELADVLHAWQGLGYYRRARALHACARALVARHAGCLPEDEAMLRALPGVGAYTARAVRAIAFDRGDLPLDGNVLRVLARLHAIETPLTAALAELEQRARALRPEVRTGDVAQALMDLGALVCRPRRPRCPACPWFSACAARTAETQEQLPRRAPRLARPVRRGLAFLLVRSDGSILFRRRPPEGLLGGLHELPSSPWLAGELMVDAALAHAPQAAEWRLRLPPVRHVFTHFVLELTLAEATTAAPPPGLWCRPSRLHELALPTIMKKVLQAAARAGGAPACRPEVTPGGQTTGRQRSGCVFSRSA